jgi:hypothetical protein
MGTEDWLEDWASTAGVSVVSQIRPTVRLAREVQILIVISGFGSGLEMVLLESGNIGSHHLGVGGPLKLGCVSKAFSKATWSD